MFDYHALAPDFIVAGTVLAVLGADLFLPAGRKWLSAVVGILGLTLALIPIATLAAGDEGVRAMLDGSYVIDDFALVLKVFFILTGYIVLLMSVAYIEEDRYYQGEYYFLLLASLLGGMVMASSRDLVTLFVGLELVSGPAFLLAGWRKADSRSNEAALKFFVIGVLSAAILVYGMSLVYGMTGSLTFEGIRAASASVAEEPVFVLGILLVLVGFGFKISAVPFHFWAPDTYEGAPTPVTAYLSVGSKAAGFVGVLLVTYVAFGGAPDIWGPTLWILAALSMVVGNLIALRQENIVRLLAYSSIAHAGFMLVPFAAAGLVEGASLNQAFEATVSYVLIYGIMNLGAFAVVIAAARRTGSGQIRDWAGLGSYAPGISILLTLFLFSLAGIPPLAGWYAKFVMFLAVLQDANGWTIVLAAIAAVNAVIALYYYARVVQSVWMDAPPEHINPEPEPTGVSPSLGLAFGMLAVAVVVVGVFPELIAQFAKAASLIAGG
ncbi:MAG: NADH-quinone oxidoreductase subunit N [Acidimicrobiia bacterium]|nr:NADH-quinone oxidoreductase subunit N [Acidimicrobiia bacterium]